MDAAWNQKRKLLNGSSGRMVHYGEKEEYFEFEWLRAPVNRKF